VSCAGRGLCDGLITRSEESYRLWCVVVCDLETSWMRRPWPTLGRSATRKRKCVKVMFIRHEPKLKETESHFWALFAGISKWEYYLRHVCLSALKKTQTQLNVFWSNLVFGYFLFWKCVKKIEFPIISDKNNGYFAWRPGASGGAVGWGTALQVGRSRVRFQMVSLDFSLT